MDKISEQILQTIDMLITKQVRELDFDKTIIGYVIGDDNKKNNFYKISYMDSVFTAYDPYNKIYNIGDCVYVKIPSGNFDNLKIIECLYAMEVK